MSTLFGLRSFEKCFENAFPYVGSAFQNLRLGTIKFNHFFANVLADYHKVPTHRKHFNNWSLEGVADLPNDGVLDLGLPELLMRVQVRRNIKRFHLPGNMTQDERIQLEKQMCLAFDVLSADPMFGGGYNSLTPGNKHFVSDAKYQLLVDSKLMFKDMSSDPFLVSAGIASDWPYGPMWETTFARNSHAGLGR